MVERRLRKVLSPAPFLLLLAALAAVALFARLPPAAAAARGDDALGETHEIGEPFAVENLTVWPVFARERSTLSDDYLPLYLAERDGTAVTRERGEGRVGEVVIENRGDQPILVLAGTAIKGGYQDRLIAQDFVIPARTTVPVEAFCVERGRWSGRRQGRSTRGRFEAQPALAVHAARETAQNEGDQVELWETVTVVNACAAQVPSTGTLMATLDDRSGEAGARRERLAGAVTGHLAAFGAAERRPVGLAYAVDGRVREMRLFASPRLFGLFVETLAGTLAIEADLAQRAALAGGNEVWEGEAPAAGLEALVREAGSLRTHPVIERPGTRVLTGRNRRVATSVCYGPESSAEPVTRQISSRD